MGQESFIACYKYATWTEDNPTAVFNNEQTTILASHYKALYEFAVEEGLFDEEGLDSNI